MTEGKKVELHRLSGRRLERTEEASGYTTHRLGSRNLDMGVAADGNGDGVPELIIPDARMTRVVGLQRVPALLCPPYSFLFPHLCVVS